MQAPPQVFWALQPLLMVAAYYPCLTWCLLGVRLGDNARRQRVGAYLVGLTALMAF